MTTDEARRAAAMPRAAQRLATYARWLVYGYRDAQRNVPPRMRRTTTFDARNRTNLDRRRAYHDGHHIGTEPAT